MTDSTKRSSVIDRALAIADRIDAEHAEWRRQPDYAHCTQRELIHILQSNRRLTSEDLAAFAEAWWHAFGENLCKAGSVSGRKNDAGQTSEPPELPPDETILSPADVVKLTGISLSTIKREVTRGRLAPSLHLSPRRIGWYARDIRAWQERIEEESRGPKRR